MATESKTNKIWEEIQNLDVEVYGLQGKKIKDVATVGPEIEPNAVYLTIKGSAILPAIEESLNKAGTYNTSSRTNVPKYVVDVVDKWVVIKPNPKLALLGAK